MPSLSSPGEAAHARCGTRFACAAVWLVRYLHGGFDTNDVC